MIIDNHGRKVNYLRLAVTDRCNLRCFYCMPEEGIEFLSRKEVLSYEEMIRMMNLMTDMGIDKVRITGGEPFIRKDLMKFIRAISKNPKLKQINITTNGTLTAPHVEELKELGIHSVNLSMDTIDPKRFYEITRRDVFPEVWDTFEKLLHFGINTKINTVVMQGKNEEDIQALVELTKDKPVSVRFIEEMPFNGTGSHYPILHWTHPRILAKIKEQYPDIYKIPDGPSSTSYNYQIHGHKGTVGIIAAFTRTFCGTCNRLRVTPNGLLKTCLYDSGVFNIKSLMRENADDEQVKIAIADAIGNRAKDGFEAENKRLSFNLPIHESMTVIGG